MNKYNDETLNHYGITKTASVNYKQHGSKVRMTVVSALAGFMKVTDIPKEGSKFWNRVSKALWDSGVVHPDSWNRPDVYVKNGRSEMVLSVTFDCDLADHIDDAYDSSFTRPLEKAFRANALRF